MSLDFEDAPECKGDKCTNLLTASSEYKRGYCGLCWEEIKVEQKDENDLSKKV